ncbi:Hsp70 family protein [Anabaena cylindrica FACHB-243]|uniref:Hsp70 family protein n=1 Tax=Anabaena TaxID=1163 RepID=UPI00149477E7|nr:MULTISPECIES: Hsp70 family protein [Anabaena]MBD2420361.1 Hsp70 family protein [Anabaena cylindrica FACHB-243]MBY5281853.1 Hsp70 family protein [Anabaena sp. CCAP 1446/1C]MBY5306998.1 Hsp70 family protein [Anabaena sp. CCAP 1446/1C]MCM2406016.1 Hsp70 family protein [Anabaena sp. CCAP 1446/1C]
MNYCNYYGFDCGTTNWRIFQVSGTESNQADSISEPQPVSLTICDSARHSLSAALLLNEDSQILACGERAYEDSSIGVNLLDAFKLCFGNNQTVIASDPNRRYTHVEALSYTGKLLSKVLDRLLEEKQNFLGNNNQFIFTHPVHWGKTKNNGEIEGTILNDFAVTIRAYFPDQLHENIHFVSEPEAALLSLVQTKQLQKLVKGYSLIVDIGGGTTDLVAGQWTSEGLQDIRYFGAAYGGNHFDQAIADYIANKFKLDELQQLSLDRQLRYYGRKFKENLSQQARINYHQPVNLIVVLAAPTETNVLRQAISLTCAEFEKITTDGQKYLHDSLLASLEEMELNSGDIGQIILVGGGARLFIVSNILREIFGNSIPIIYGDPPESTVARGAALWGMRSSLLTKKTIDILEELVVNPLPKNEVIINDSQPAVIVQISTVYPTHHLNIMNNNTQIRQEMEQVQAELQSALKEIIILAKKELKPEQFKEIEVEFQELNELLERLKTGLVYIGLFGKTGAGKSAIANSLIGSDIAGVNVANDFTREVMAYQKEPWNIVDVPGIMGDPVYEKMALDEARKSHGLIFVINSEPYEPELKLFEWVHNAVPNIPKIVFVNKWDVLEAGHDDAELKVVRQKITEKMGKFVKSPNDIIYGSARIKQNGTMVRQELPQLLNKMYEDAGTLGQVMNILDPAHRADDLTQNINNKILEVRIKIARKAINGFAVGAVASEFIPFTQLILTPGILASMVFTVIKIMGKQANKEDAKKMTKELLTACGQVLGVEFAAVAAADLLLDIITVVTGPIGAAIALFADVSALGYYKYQRTAILGEVTIEYVRNNYSWAGSQQAVIKRCKETASQHYFSIQKKNK